jgi:VRR-NUC domain
MPRRRPEQQIQTALAAHLRLRASKDVFWFACENGGGRSAIEAAILKSCGIKRGVPDLILIKSGRTYGLELKAPGGRLSDAQRLAHDEMRAAGAEVAVAVGIDQALDQLERWQLLRGAVQ